MLSVYVALPSILLILRLPFYLALGENRHSTLSQSPVQRSDNASEGRKACVRHSTVRSATTSDDPVDHES